MIMFFFFLWSLLSCVVCPGPAEGNGPAQTKGVCYSSCPAAVPQLPQSGPVTLADLETHEATYAGRTVMEECYKQGFCKSARHLKCHFNMNCLHLLAMH